MAVIVFVVTVIDCDGGGSDGSSRGVGDGDGSVFAVVDTVTYEMVNEQRAYIELWMQAGGCLVRKHVTDEQVFYDKCP